MKTYDVTIQATVTKTIRVKADNQEAAYCEAHEQFTTECDGDEYYEEQTLHVDEVTEWKHINLIADVVMEKT